LSEIIREIREIEILDSFVKLVSLFLLIANESKILLAHFGLRESVNSKLIRVYNTHLIRDNINLGEQVYEAPVPLDCDKYTIKRSKRQVHESVIKCLYNFDYDSTLAEGIQEEAIWEKLSSNGVEMLYCEDGF